MEENSSIVALDIEQSYRELNININQLQYILKNNEIRISAYIDGTPIPPKIDYDGKDGSYKVYEQQFNSTTTDKNERAGNYSTKENTDYIWVEIAHDGYVDILEEDTQRIIDAVFSGKKKVNNMGLNSASMILCVRNNDNSHIRRLTTYFEVTQKNFCIHIGEIKKIKSTLSAEQRTNINESHSLTDIPIQREAPILQQIGNLTNSPQLAENPKHNPDISNPLIQNNKNKFLQTLKDDSNRPSNNCRDKSERITKEFEELIINGILKIDATNLASMWEVALKQAETKQSKRYIKSKRNTLIDIETKKELNIRQTYKCRKKIMEWIKSHLASLAS
jgi:hypothetical protein